MNNSRRAFLRNSSLLAGGAMALGHEAFAAKAIKQIVGIQLYSVPDDICRAPANKELFLRKARRELFILFVYD